MRITDHCQCHIVRQRRFSMAARSRFWLAPVRTHYEVLGLQRTCTVKEIKEAFVKLSKEFHPDRNVLDTSRHEKCVKLNEAYTILVKSETRQEYDRLLNARNRSQYPFWTDTTDVYQMRKAAHHKRSQYSGTGFWNETPPSSDRYKRAGPYYGIKGIDKVPNWYIVVGCCIFILLGVTGHFFAIRYGNRVSREALDRKDELYSSQYDEVKSQAKEHGNAFQMELLKQRLIENEESCRN